jgi:ribonuclease kappa
MAISNGNGVAGGGAGPSPSVSFRGRQIRCSLRFCGPKLSMCGLLLSVWGIVQLVIMGICMHVRSVAFIEDLGFEFNQTHNDEETLKLEMESAFEKGATNCWVAALLYLVLLLISAHQFWLNSRITPTGYQRYN